MCVKKFCLHFKCYGYIEEYIRDVVQPGRALAWGARSRRFESSRPDHFEESGYVKVSAYVWYLWEVFE